MERLALSQRSRFNVLAILIGALSAVAFHKSIYWAEHNGIYRVSQIPGWLGVVALIFLPAAAGLLVGFLLKHWAPEAAQQFVNTERTALPVVSRLDEGRVVGVVTLRDITRQQFLQETKRD